MKWMIPMLTMLIFLVQIHCIFYSASNPEKEIISPKSLEIPEERQENCLDDSEKIETIIVNCVIKCSLAFLGGILLSDGKFIRFGVI